MVTKESLGRRLDKILEAKSASDAANEVHQLVKDFDQYIDEKIRKALEATR